MDDFATGYLAGQDGGNNNGGFFGNEGLWAVIILANFRSMMDYFTQDKIATLTAENQSLKFAASQDRQNALLTTVMSQQTDTILNRVNPRPIPAYQVANPNAGVNCCGC